jgi:hypothetical protein
LRIPALGELWTVRHPVKFYVDRLIPVAPGEPLLILEPEAGGYAEPGTVYLLHILVKGHEVAAYVNSSDIVPLEEWMLR